MSAASHGAPCATAIEVPTATLHDRLGGLRLRNPGALEAMVRSLARHGQLTPVVAFSEAGRYEVIDGFKRLHAARELGWNTLWVTTSDLAVVEAKVQMVALHDRQHRLTEIEEAWLVRSLHRDDGLSQGEIGRRLERHKSWVCRRLLLVEALDCAVQADVRLGMLAPRAAVALAALPRGNQASASAAVIRRGLTVRQTELFVAEILELPDDCRGPLIHRRLEGGAPSPERPPVRAVRSEADWMAADIATALRVASRLQARLLARPIDAFGSGASEVIFDGLIALAPTLTALSGTVSTVIGRERAA